MKSSLMRPLSPAALLLLLCAPCARAQTEPADAQPPQIASTILNPAISTLQQSLDRIRLEKWKTSNAVRDETESNMNSVRRDLDSTLPALIATADAAPGSVVQVLPAYRNIEALYDVLLRIAAVGHLAAPAQQSAALDQAMASLDTARRSLGDQIQSSAVTQDQKVHTLQASLRATPPAAAPTPAPCTPPPAAPAKKHKARPKAAPAPVTPAPSAP